MCLLMSLSGSRGNAQSIRDIIAPVNLTVDRCDTLRVGNLFYLSDYRLRFRPDTMVAVRYDSVAGYLMVTPSAEAEGWYPLEFSVHDHRYVIPVRVQIRPSHTFRYQSPDSIGRIMVFGSFNSWNRNEFAMNRVDGVWKTTIAIDPGRYEYKFLIDGQEKIDPANPEKVPNPFGDFNSILSVSPRHPEQAYLHLESSRHYRGNLELTFCLTVNDRPYPIDSDGILALLDNRLMDRSQIRVKQHRMTVSLSRVQIDSSRQFRVAVTLTGSSARDSQSNQLKGLSSLMQTVFLEPYHLRTSSIDPILSGEWEESIIYSIMIDRFMDGDKRNNHPVEHPELPAPANFQGGDLSGIIQKIRQGYFDSLGINVLWISPVNQNTLKAEREYPEPHRYYSGYHGYWPSEPQQVDTRFGSSDELKELVELAHQHGIRVLLDFVAHHVHQDHPFFRDHPEWFGRLELPDGRKNLRLWDEYRLTTWFEPYLPSFDFVSSREALEAMTDNAVWWLKETGIDGFRHDAVKHVPNSFWEVLTRKIRQQIELPSGKSIYQIGETFGSYDLISSYVNHGQLDAQFNFNLFFTARNTFLSPESPLTVVHDEMQKTFQVYGMNHRMGNLMDSHDQIRYIALADGDLKLDSPDAQEIAWNNPPRVDSLQSYSKAELFMAYMLTIPGIPVIYYGDEIGMTGSSDPDNRRMMRFGVELIQPEQTMRERISRLCAVRRENPALTRGDFYTVAVDHNGWAYLRSCPDQRVLVVLNKGSESKSLELNVPDFYQASQAVDLTGRSTLSIRDHKIRVDLPPYGYGIYRLK